RVVRIFGTLESETESVSLKDFVRAEGESVELQSYQGLLSWSSGQSFGVFPIGEAYPSFQVQIWGPEVLVPLYNLKLKDEYVSFIHSSSYGTYNTEGDKSTYFYCEFGS